MRPVLVILGVVLIRLGVPLLRPRPVWQRALAVGYARYGGRRAALKVRADRVARRPTGAVLVGLGLASLVAALAR